MIRPILAVLITTSILLFVWQYAAFIERNRPAPIEIQVTSGAGRFDVKVVCTCDCQGNAYGNSAIKIEFRDRVLEDRTELTVAGQEILIVDVADIVVGLNDFNVQVTPVENSSTASGGGAFSLEGPAEASRSNSILRLSLIHISEPTRPY